MMYLFKFEDALISLYVNFQGYLELMIKAKGTFYWQYLILDILEKKENAVSARIKENLPKIFPDFSFVEFEKLFKKLKLK